MVSRHGAAFTRGLGFAALLLASRTAHADVSAAQKETARTLMAEGRELREHRDLKAALDRFQAADAIMGVPTTGFELARAQVDLSLLVEARASLRRVLALPVHEADPPPFQEARAKAEALDAELEARIPSLRFVLEGVAPGETATLSVDGEVVASAALAMPYRINPGHHVISARTARASGERAIDVGERESSDVTLRLDRNAPPPSPASAEQRSGRIPTLAYVAGSVGAAGLLVGGISGVLALSAKNAAQDGCQGQRCPPQTWPNLDRADTYATVSTVGFVVGAVGASIAVGSLLFGSDDDEPPVHAFVSVRQGASSLSVAGRF